MKRTRFLLTIGMSLLSFFSAVNAEEVVKEKMPYRFGVGISYDFKNRIRRAMHPIEFTIRYKLPERHTFYLNVPLGWKKWKDDYSFPATYKMKLYGLGIGYDYSIARCEHLELFAGGGFEYQRLNYRYKEEDEEYDIFVPPGPIRLFNSFGSAKFNDFAIYPKVGLRYTYRFVGIEFDYRYYVSKRGMHEYYSGGLFSYEFVHDTRLSPAFHCGVYFLF